MQVINIEIVLRCVIICFNSYYISRYYTPNQNLACCVLLSQNHPIFKKIVLGTQKEKQNKTKH